MALVVEPAQRRLRTNIALLREPAPPVRRLTEILCHTLAIGVYLRQIDLRRDATLLGSLAVPVGRLGIIHVASLTLEIHPGQTLLGTLVTLLRKHGKFLEGLIEVAGIGRLDGLVKTGRRQRRPHQQRGQQNPMGTKNLLHEDTPGKCKG